MQARGTDVSRVRSFGIAVPDAVLADLRDRLSRTRPARGAITGWPAGTDPDYLASFVTSWADAYQWRDTESVLNGLPQLLVRVAGVDIHVFHIRALARTAGAPPVPLVLTHGWPSSFFEFLPLIGPLTDPAAHGCDPADAFDVVIPSLPGFGYSGPLPAGHNQPARIADLWAELMDQLGYQRFGAYGGDIGSHVTNFLGARHPGRLIGIFTHHPQLHPRLDGARPLSAAEQRYLEQRAARTGHEGSYAATQSARPNPARSPFTSMSTSWTSSMPRWRRTPTAAAPGLPSTRPQRRSKLRWRTRGRGRCRSGS